jgi:ribosomal protein S18 acetylase RimI-like enzyme
MTGHATEQYGPAMNKQNYQQRNELPGVDEYRALRDACGLPPRTTAAASKGLPNSVFSTSIRDQGRLIAMGRLVGDGGCNLEVVDIAVHPDYQRRGLGSLIMSEIMSYISENTPPSAFTSLIADHHSPALYSKFGFEPTAPVSIGMSFRVK